MMGGEIALGIALCSLGTFGLFVGGILNYWIVGIALAGAAGMYYLGYYAAAAWISVGGTTNLFQTNYEYFVLYAAVALSVSGGLTAALYNP
jgi:hypothetical protein